MQHLGQTRSRREADHFLLTPDTFVRAPLPGMEKATAVVHAAPANGAGFTEYTAELEAGGTLQTGGNQTFLFLLKGELSFQGKLIRRNGYAYLSDDGPVFVTATTESIVVVIEKPYHDIGLSRPACFIGDESSLESTALMGDEDIAVRTMIPPGPVFDFAVNTMSFEPGASLPMVEIHVMEHGLLMLQGEGIYRLNERWYPVTAGDFIYMAPYCPQWFAAIGKRPAKYLIYKDWNRHPIR